MDKKMYLDFLHEYDVEMLNETPANDKNHYYYPGATRGGGQDGLLVKISPYNGSPWLGTFARGRSSFYGIFSMPDPKKICVVSGGIGYIVSAKEASNWEQLKVSKTVDVRLILAHNLIVFVDADLTTIVAYDSTGLRWSTKQIGLDGLQITEITEKHIKGKYWNMRSGSDDEFSVEIETGAIFYGIK